jgi:hypothetical protein
MMRLFTAFLFNIKPKSVFSIHSFCKMGVSQIGGGGGMVVLMLVNPTNSVKYFSVLRAFFRI